MASGTPVIVPDVRTVPLRASVQEIYSEPIELQQLYLDPRSGAEHYVVRYPSTLTASWHRHSVAHTIVVIEGELLANGEALGVGGYAHFPAGAAMHHAPVPGVGCTFIIIFDGAFDVEAIAEPQ
jgi:hypothetical protein